MPIRLLPALALALAAALAAPAGAEEKFEFETFSLVILRRGANPPKLDEAASEKLQQEHLGHLRKMHDAGKMVIAGPLGDQPDQTMRGLCLYRTPLAEAKALAEQDPAVRAGRLRVEAMTWFVGKGHMAFPKAPSPPRQAQ